MNKTNDIQEVLDASIYPLNEESIKLILKAFEYVKKCYKGKTRKSGELYHIRSLSVAKIVSGVGMGPRVIAASILFNVLEDTQTTKEDLEKEFDKTVAFYVDSLSFVKKIKYQGTLAWAKSLQKFFIIKSKDLRVIVISLAICLQNMRTIDENPLEEQEKNAREAQQLYAPIADRLGMGVIKSEIEELSFKVLEPVLYEKTKKLLFKRKNPNLLLKLEEDLKTLADIEKIHFKEIQTRMKGVYSAYEKIKNKGKEDLRDIFAARIIVETVNDTYSLLGSVINAWEVHDQKGIKDYISSPKKNGYRALHTNICFEGEIVEIQICTKEMYLQSKLGAASHFEYKDKRHGIQSLKTNTLNELLGGEGDTSWEERVHHLYEGDDPESTTEGESGFLKERIFVFSPKKEVVDLPKGATVLDFAYSIHGDIGNKTIGAFVNDKNTFLSIDKKLNDGDKVEIKTSKNAEPKEKWLSFVITQRAKANIREALRKKV